jgi:putative FmdB family regulatory protein
MPIFEFHCLSCDHVFELLSLCRDDAVEMKCPECQSMEIEKVLSRVSYVMGGSSGSDSAKPKVTTKSCSGGTCASIDIPGPSR